MQILKRSIIENMPVDIRFSSLKEIALNEDRYGRERSEAAFRSLVSRYQRQLFQEFINPLEAVSAPIKPISQV